MIAEKNARWKERVAVAKTLSDAKVKFAFEAEGAGNSAANFPAQLRKVIAAGLSREAAVDALTRRAAEIAGVGKRLGTIEKGKLGHLVVMTGPVGDERRQGPATSWSTEIKFDTREDRPPYHDAKKGAGPRGEAEGRQEGASQPRRSAKAAPKKDEAKDDDEPEKGAVEKVADKVNEVATKVAEATKPAEPRRRPTSPRPPKNPRRPRPPRTRPTPQLRPTDSPPGPRTTRAGDARSSTSPPSSTPTASRRSGPAGPS